MAILSRWTEQSGDGGFFIFCPGCRMPHMVAIGAGKEPRWAFDGNEAAPTFSPSLLVKRGHFGRADPRPGNCYCDAQARGIDSLGQTCGICHSFVRAGMIEFLSDSTHDLAGQTVPLPDYPEEWE